MNQDNSDICADCGSSGQGKGTECTRCGSTARPPRRIVRLTKPAASPPGVRLSKTPPDPVTQTDHPPPTVAPVARPTTSAPPTRSSRSALITIGVLSVALILVVGLVGGLLLGKGDNPATSAGSPGMTQEPAPARNQLGSGDGSGETSGSTTSLEVPDQVGIRCWDGSVVAARANCTRPSGPAGLAWVFPSFAPDSPQCYDALLRNPDVRRPTMWECTTTVNGREVLIRYSELGDTTTGRTYYDEQYVEGSRETVTDDDGRPTRYVWRLQEANDVGIYKLSSMYVDYPYSISIEASNPTARDAALTSMLAFRRPQDIRGES